MADTVCPGDILKMTSLVGSALKGAGFGKATANMQVLICERILLPLAVNHELRRGLASLAQEESYGRADRKAAMEWLLKLVGAEPL